MTTERAEVAAERVKPLILVASDHVSESSLSLLIEASRSVGAGLLQWKSQTQLAPSRTPSLIVASLMAGARRVPADVAHLVSEVFPRLPLLLLCNEPLVRPTVTTEAGRVTLVGPPLSRSRLGARLRMLLAGSEERPASELVVQGEPRRAAVNRFSSREARQPEYWIGAFGSHDAGPWPLPIVHRDALTGLSVLLAEPRSETVELERVATALARSESDESKEATLCELLGGTCAVVHLTPGAGDWIVYLPRRDWPFRLFSPVRLPHLTDLSRALELSQRCLFRLRAAPGDLMVGLTADFGLWERSSARAALLDGGPALLELLGDGALEVAESFSGILAEVL